jgi:hypothetical protein
MVRFLDVLQPTRSQLRSGVIGFIVFQSDYAAEIDTVLVIPCRDIAANLDLGKLTPKLQIKGRLALAMVPQMAGIDRGAFEGVVIANATDIRDELIQALDRLVTGF